MNAMLQDGAACAHGVSLMLFCARCEANAQALGGLMREAQQAEADRRIVAFHQAAYGPSPDDVWAEEPEDVCRGCGAPNVSHMRTERDNYCGECRFPDRE